MSVWGAKLKSMAYLLDAIKSKFEQRSDVLESLVSDAEVQKLSWLGLVDFVVSEIKTRISA